MTNIVSQITGKLFKIKNMSDIKYPEFLNTKEQYDECVRNILTVKQFEGVFRKLLDDDALPMTDCLKIMAKLEHNTITTHGNNDVSCIMDMADAIINYHYITSKEKLLREKSSEKQDMQNITDDCVLCCTSTSDSEQEEEGCFEPDSGARQNSC